MPSPRTPRLCRECSFRTVIMIRSEDSAGACFHMVNRRRYSLCRPRAGRPFSRNRALVNHTPRSLIRRPTPSATLVSRPTYISRDRVDRSPARYDAHSQVAVNERKDGPCRRRSRLAFVQSRSGARTGIHRRKPIPTAAATGAARRMTYRTRNDHNGSIIVTCRRFGPLCSYLTRRSRTSARSCGPSR